MNEEIKKILRDLKFCSGIFDYTITPDRCTFLKDYITNLQQENENLKSQLKGTTHCFDEAEHKKLEEENKQLKEKLKGEKIKYKEMIYQAEQKRQILCTGVYKNYTFYILNLGTHPTAYIKISVENRKFYMKDYHMLEDENIYLDVHGGLTYSNNELYTDEYGVLKGWFIGWDYAHFRDYYAYNFNMPEHLKIGLKKWMTEEIVEECKNAIEQIIEISEK